jgi:hypothetical protein
MPLEPWLVVPFIAVLLGAIPATLAARRGRSYGRWWVYGAVLFPVALFLVLRLPAAPTLRPCPHCLTPVQMSAPRCHECLAPLPRTPRAALRAVPASRFKTRQQYERWKAERERQRGA